MTSTQYLVVHKNIKQTKKMHLDLLMIYTDIILCNFCNQTNDILQNDDWDLPRFLGELFTRNLPSGIHISM